MKPLERVRRRLRGEPVDRAPNFDIYMQRAAHHVGRPLSRYYLDHRVLVEANLAVTYTQRDGPGRPGHLGALHCQDVQTQTGYVVVTSHLDLRLQLQTDSRYGTFVSRASTCEVLGLKLPVARVEDVLQGKIWAVQDPTRRASKRQKDLADISRLVEVRPELRDRVPADVLARLI